MCRSTRADSNTHDRPSPSGSSHDTAEKDYSAASANVKSFPVYRDRTSLDFTVTELHPLRMELGYRLPPIDGASACPGGAGETRDSHLFPKLGTVTNGVRLGDSDVTGRPPVAVDGASHQGIGTNLMPFVTVPIFSALIASPDAFVGHADEER